MEVVEEDSEVDVGEMTSEVDAAAVSEGEEVKLHLFSYNLLAS